MRNIPEIIMNYRQMEMTSPGSSMLREVRQQYADMASGGDGGCMGFAPDGWTKGRYPTCREYNYPNHPDSFFQEVCDLMGWHR